MKAVSILTQQADEYTLEQALLIYRSKGGSPYVTAHKITRTAGGPTIGAGRPASIPALRNLANAISAVTATSGWVDARTLYIGPGILVWHRPAAPATLFFAGDGKKSPAFSGVAPQPALIFAVTPGHWFVWAVKSNACPDAQTPLCQAPYFNVYDDGEICTGNVTLPKTLSPDTATGFERAFFDSRFTHANADALTVSDTATLWRYLVNSGRLEFPPAELIETRHTLGAALQRLTKGSS